MFGIKKTLRQKDNTKVNTIVSKLNNDEYSAQFDRNVNNEIIIPIKCERVSDLYQNVSINDVQLLEGVFYDVLLQNISGLRISEDIVIYIDSKTIPTNEEKKMYALAHKHGFLMNAVSYTERKNRLTKKAWWVLILFLISLFFIAVIEFIMIKFESELAKSISWKVTAKMIEEIIFVVMWVLGWTYCDIIFFDQKDINREIATRYQAYKARIIYKKDKNKPKVSATEKFEEVDKILKTKEAGDAEKIFLKQEKHDEKEMQKIQEKELKEIKKEEQKKDVVELKDTKKNEEVVAKIKEDLPK